MSSEVLDKPDANSVVVEEVVIAADSEIIEGRGDSICEIIDEVGRGDDSSGSKEYVVGKKRWRKRLVE